ncbi:hypothetical protein D3C79_908490 [compost metagenome]
MTGDVPTLEAAIEHMSVVLSPGADVLQALSQLWITTGAIECTQVEVGQFSFKQVWDVRTDRMGIPQQRIAKLFA